MRFKNLTFLILALGMFLSFVEQSIAVESRTNQKDSPEEKFGVTAVSLRPTAAGTMLDFRYKVLDSQKAKSLFDKKIKPILVEPKSHIALGMPEETKLGSLRASVRNPPVVGKNYYVLFSNGYGSIKKGDRVTVILGDCRIKDVLVE